MRNRARTWGVLIGVACGFAVMAAASVARGDVSFTIVPGSEPLEVIAEPPTPAPILWADQRPATTGGIALRIYTADATVYQVLPGDADPALPGGRVVVSGEHAEYQLAFPMDRTSVRVEGNVYLVTTGAAAWRPHPGDFNRDGRVSVQDIFEFLQWWCAGEGDPAALMDFLAAWFV
jgi:hypothetical protein